MPIRVRCTDCATEYNLADRLAGKKIRCKKCESIVVVPSAEDEEISEAVAAPVKKGDGVKAKTRPSAVRDEDDEPRPKRRREEEDDEDDPRPIKKGARGGKKKLPMAWIIGGSVGGVLVIAGIIVAFMMTRNKANSTNQVQGSEKDGKDALVSAPLTVEDMRQAVKDRVLLASGYYRMPKPEVRLLTPLVEPSEQYFQDHGQGNRNMVACYVSISRSPSEADEGAGFFELMVLSRDNGSFKPKDKGKPIIDAQYGEIELIRKYLGETWLAKNPFPKRGNKDPKPVEKDPKLVEKDPKPVEPIKPVTPSPRVIEAITSFTPTGTRKYASDQKLFLSQNGKRLTVFDRETNITQAWELGTTPKKVYETKGYLSAVSADGMLAVITGQVVDLQTKKMGGQLPANDLCHFVSSDLIVTAATSHDNRKAAPFTVRGFNPRDGKQLFLFTAAEDDRGNFTILNQGRELAFGMEKSNLIKIWDLSTQKLVRAVQLPSSASNGSFYCLQANRDGKLIAVEGGSTFDFWDGESGKNLHSITRNSGPLSGYLSRFIPTRDIYLSPSNYLRDVKTGSPLEVVAYDVVKKTILAVFRGHKHPISALTVSGDGKWMATWDQQGNVMIWDLDKVD